MKALFKFKFAAAALFWSWNIIFMAFMLLGFAPIILIALVQGVIDGWVPWTFLAFAGTLVFIPMLSIVIAVIALRGHTERLFALGYGVQGPLMVVLAARFFALRELTPPLIVMIVAAVLGLLALLWQLLDKTPDARGGFVRGLRLVGITLLLGVGLYISVFMAFYALPAAALIINIIGDFFSFLPRVFERGWRETGQMMMSLPFFLLGFILLIYSATLFVLMPIAVPIIYVKAWLRSVRAAKNKFGLPMSVGAAGAAFLALVVGCVALNRQTQVQSFALLKNPPKTLAEAQALKNQEPLLREGLLNAYLAQYRYTSAAGEVSHIQEVYQNTVHFSPDMASGVQQMYEGVVAPLLYQPAQPLTQTASWQNTALVHDANTASQLYEQYFDEPLNKAERPTVVNAVRSTWDVSRATQAWQAVDDREILLTKQELTLKEQDGYADVELYEVYQNQTNLQQEVVYYFNLPESAVVTGLWLGDSPDRSKRFVYKVAPRGAAQQVYREQVTVFRRDPALLEQIGPRQYRLRVFPIEPPRFNFDSTRGRSVREDAQTMHMWLTWRMLPEAGAWQLPKLAEKRNVYWSARSVRTVNGKEVLFDLADDAWLPPSLPIANPITPTPRRVDFGNGQSVVAVPAKNYPLTKPNQYRLAIVIDRSRSMGQHDAEIQLALKLLYQVAGASSDVYLTSSPVRGEAASVVKPSHFDARTIFYFGGQDSAELLTQFAALSKGQTYDAVLVLTDDSGYELNKENREMGSFASPIWMVHLGGGLPLGYDDKMLEAIQASGGGVVMSIDDVFTRLAARTEPDRVVDVSSGYAWVTVPTAQAEGVSAHAQHYKPSDGFASFAARRLILAEVQRNKGKLSDPQTLDTLHKIAVEQSIVTPYSSMLVLVNDEQRRRLEELEKGNDRFQREKEQVGETQNPVVTGVPEPHEWLLMGIAAAMLGWYALKRKKTNLARA